MEGMSEREYSAHSDLSRGALQKARKTGRLVLFADGSINAAASDARRVAMTDPDQQMRSKGGFGGSGGASSDGNAVSGPGESTSHLDLQRFRDFSGFQRPAPNADALPSLGIICFRRNSRYLHFVQCAPCPPDREAIGPSISIAVVRFGPLGFCRSLFEIPDRASVNFDKTEHVRTLRRLGTGGVRAIDQHQITVFELF
jgi:hypothetical protein